VEEEVNIFLIYLMGVTIQDGGSRERKDPGVTLCLLHLALFQ